MAPRATYVVGDLETMEFEILDVPGGKVDHQPQFAK